MDKRDWNIMGARKLTSLLDCLDYQLPEMSGEAQVMIESCRRY